MKLLHNRPVQLSALWVFSMFNYLYADVLSLMDKNTLQNYLAGSVAGMTIDQNFLFFASLLMETAIVMTLLSRLLPRTANRILNIVFGSFHTLAVIGSNFIGTQPTNYNLMYSIIEALATISIVVLAIKWPKPVEKISE